MDASQIALIGAAIVLFSLVSRRLGRTPITMPMTFVFAGWATYATGLVELEFELEAIVLLSEVTLAVILFGDAVRLNTSALRKDFVLPARLLGIGLPLSIALGTVMVTVLIPAFSLAEAALVAAILAPTDAALGQAVVEDASVPLRIRQALNVESGLNDGLALPAVLLFVALAAGEEASAGFWGRFVLEQIGLGILVGVAVGSGAGWILHKARDGGWVDGVYAQLATLSVAITTFAFAISVGANGFLATFVAGLAYGTVIPDQVADLIDEYTEDTGRLLAVIAFFVFGNILVAEYLGSPSLAVIVCAALSLTVGRLLPVALALIGLRPAPPTLLFLGWFGPRGLASILFGLLLLEEDLAAADDLFGIISWTVMGSVVLHGATASWGARRYGRWWAEMADEEGIELMVEAKEVEVTRPRWRS